jgi:hypothetical protein
MATHVPTKVGTSSGGLVPQLVSRRSSAEARRQKSGVSDRHGRSLWAGQSFNLGTELLRERLDDARAEPGFWLSKDAVRLAARAEQSSGRWFARRLAGEGMALSRA